MRTLIKNGRLIDGTGRPALADGVVLVEGGRIVAVGAADAVAAGTQEATVVDAHGGTILPGLIDCHVHILGGTQAGSMNDHEQALNGAVNAGYAIDAGLTTVRDTGSRSGAVFALRAFTANNRIRGPRILAAGKLICMTGGHGYSSGREADGPDEVRKATREQIKAGADWIKLCSTGGAATPVEKITSTQLDEDELRAAVREASKAGLRVAVHAHATPGIKDALRAGASTIEHGVFMDDEAVRMMVDQGAFMVPTLSAYRCIVERGAEQNLPAHMRNKAAEVVPHHIDSVRRALDGGAKVAFGTDSGGFYHPIGRDVVMELEMLRESGLGPMQLVRSITGLAAEALGIEDQLGTLEVGKLADVVIVDGDPLTDLRAMGRVRFVMKEGTVL